MKRPMPTNLRWIFHSIWAIISLSVLILWMAFITDTSYRFWLLYFPAGCVIMTIFSYCFGWGVHSIFDERREFIPYSTRTFIVTWLFFSSTMFLSAFAVARILAREAGLISEFTKDDFWYSPIMACGVVWCLFFVLAYPYCGLVTYRKEKSHP